MSMECDTRLSMMALRNDTQQSAVARPRRKSRRPFRSVASITGLAAFALTLFTKGV